MRTIQQLFVLGQLLLMFPTTHAQDSHRIEVDQLRDSVFVCRSFKQFKVVEYSANCLLVQSDSGIVLIDTPWGEVQTEKLIQWVRDSLHSSITLAIVTHAHDDRIIGIDVLRKADIQVVSTDLVGEYASRNGFSVPDRELNSDSVFHFNGLKMEVVYPGKGHSPDNTLVWFPDLKILHAGCFLKSGTANHIGNIKDASLQHWPVAVKAMQKRFHSAKTVVPGHGPTGGTEAFSRTLLLLESLGKSAPR